MASAPTTNFDDNLHPIGIVVARIRFRSGPDAFSVHFGSGSCV